MAFDAYLKIDTIEGESRARGFEGAIDVLSYSFGIQRPAPVDGRASGRPEFTDLSVVVPQSAATVPLMLAAATGQQQPTAVLSLRRVTADGTEPYFRMELTQVSVTSVHEGASTGDERPTDAVALAFVKWRVSYRPQRGDGTFEPAVEGGYDLAEGRVL